MTLLEISWKTASMYRLPDPYQNDTLNCCTAGTTFLRCVYVGHLLLLLLESLDKLSAMGIVIMDLCQSGVRA